MYTLTIGDKAYFDAFSGLIPCRVTDIKGLNGIASTGQTVTVEITAKWPGFHKGELIKTSGLHAIPRNAVRRRKLGTRIAPYHVFVGIHAV